MVVGRMAAQDTIRPAPLEVVLAVVFGAMLGVIKSDWYGHLELTDEVRAIAEQCCWEAIRA